MDSLTASVSKSREDTASSDWFAFSAADTEDALCAAWIKLLCARFDGVVAGLLLLHDRSGEAYVPAAVWPDARQDLSYLGPIAENALKSGRGLVSGLGNDEAAPPGRLFVACPLDIDDSLPGVVVLDISERPDAAVQEVLRELLWGTGWLRALVHQRRARQNQEVLERARHALKALQAAQEQATVVASAMATLNEIVTSLGINRAGLGLLEKDKLKLTALSRTAWFDGRSQLVQDIENAMEEAIDQETVICHPPLISNGRGFVSAAQRDLAERSGAAAILSFPLTQNGRIIGAITLERDTGVVFDLNDIHLAELMGELLGPWFAGAQRLEHWFAGKMPDMLGRWRQRLLGGRWPSVPLTAAGIMVVLLYLGFADGQFRVTARTVIEGQMQRAAVAPFDGYVANAAARAGDIVEAGQLLAELDDREIRLELSRWVAEREQASRRYREALARRDAAASRIFAAQQQQAEAQVAIAEHQLSRTRILAPIDSVVVAGDLSQLLGAPVERGKVLFELAPLSAYRVILQVDDRDIGYINVDQQGELVLSGVTGSAFPFTVKSVTSVSTPESGRNYFRVEATIEDPAGRLRPGMEGIGKIMIGEQGQLWIWTRNFISWLRISFWSLLP